MDISKEIRIRSKLEEKECYEQTDLQTMLDNILYERIVEFAGEGKAWYDFLRVGRYQDPSGRIDFKKDFLIDYVLNYNKQAGESWLNTVLNNENAWYLPISETEMKSNSALVQNPYYL